ncbi:DUF6566 family protein [Herbaspirillum sp. RV1423]|uniref:DUF6566 family protein n=1 Tax=Herbaspirillum sp. RV1423 TaxID=1443993 RepID=UPI0004B2667E|nr:DUF6566 family protein [Herbaspirillum sp. RV1423]
MAQYGSIHRGKHFIVQDSTRPGKNGVFCAVEFDGEVYTDIKGAPFESIHSAQMAGASFARALIDSDLDGDSYEHRGYFIRATSNEQRDGTWAGGYQLHRNDNPVPFRRASCEPFRGNTRKEAENNAVAIARRMIDEEVAAGKL